MQTGTKIAIAIAAVLATASASASTTVTYPYADEVLLHASEKKGGLAYVTAGVEEADEPAPVVVYLHGLNDCGSVHFWYGLFNTDLRPLADEIVAGGKVRPFVLAAPSQTYNAGSMSTMWSEFDLDTFLDATDAALPDGVWLDRDAVIVVGHSGAGCNLKGGLLGTLSPFVATRPAGIIAADTCFDTNIGTALGAVPVGTPVFAFYQPFTWNRDFEPFRTAFKLELERVPGRVGTIVVEDKNGNDPHNAILERALREALPSLIPIETPDPYQ
jgi:hypothetical protein